MTNETTDKLRALLLAAIMIISVVGSSAAAVGTIAADDGSLVGETVDQTTNTVDDTTDTVDETTSTIDDSTGTLDGTTDTVDDTTDTIDDTTDTIDDTTESITDDGSDSTSAESTVDPTTVVERLEGLEDPDSPVASALADELESPEELDQLTDSELVSLLAGFDGVSPDEAVELVHGNITDDSSGFELEASDGAGYEDQFRDSVEEQQPTTEPGNTSRLFEDFDGQLPEGAVSGDDTLQLEAVGDEPLPDQFRLYLTIDGDDVAFDTDQNNLADFDVKVYGSNVVMEDDELAGSNDIRVDQVSEDVVALSFNFEDGTSNVTTPPEAEGVRITNLTFDAAEVDDTSTDTLQWSLTEIRGDRTSGSAAYNLDVVNFDPVFDFHDEFGGENGALTAGADNQRLYGAQNAADPSANERAQNVSVTVNESSEFPDRFTFNLSLSDGSGITFADKLSEEDVNVTSADENVTTDVVHLGSDRIEVAVRGFQADDGSASDLEGQLQGDADFTVEGLRFDATPDATTTNLTWEIGGEEDSYSIEPERLNFAVTSDEPLPRGAANAGNVSVTVDNSDTQSGSFYEAGNEMQITIPEAYSDDLSFDRSAAIQSDDVENVSITENEIAFTVGQDIGNDDASIVEFVGDQFQNPYFDVPDEFTSGTEIELSGIQFNVSGVDETKGEDAELTSGLTFQYESGLNGGDEITVESDGTPIETLVPAVTTTPEGPAVLSPNEDNQSASVPVNVTIQDTEGGQINATEDIVVGIDGAVSFNDSQELATKGNIPVKDVTVNDNQIVVDVDEFFLDSTTAGDSLTLYSEDGDGIAFDAAESGSGTLTVQTSPGDEAVVQTTETELLVTDQEMVVDTDAISAGVDTNVSVTVVDENGNAVDDGTVSVDGPGVSDESQTNENGVAEFTLNPDGAGEITFTYEDDTGEPIEQKKIDSTVSIDVQPQRVPVDQESSVTVTLNGAANESLEGVTLDVDADEGIGYNDAKSDDATDEDGQAELVFEPTDNDSLATISFTTLETNVTVEASETGLAVDTDYVEVGETQPVEVTVIGGASDSVPVTASGSALEDSEQQDIDVGETGTFQVSPEFRGEINFTRDDIENASETVETVDMEVPDEIDVGETTNVTVEVFEGRSPADDLETVEASGNASDTNESVQNGAATLSLAPDDEGSIEVTATGNGYEINDTISASLPKLVVEPNTVTVGSKTNVTVTIEEVDDDVVSNEPISVEDPNGILTNDSEVQSETGTDGEAYLTLEATEAGSVTIDAPDTQVEPATVTFEENSSNESPPSEGDEEEEPDTGGDTGGGIGGGGGGGGGAAPVPSPDFNVTDVTLAVNEIECGETVDVTVTVANEGDADGEYDVRVKANTVTVENETVGVAAGETVEVTIPVTFYHTGKRTISVDGVKGGKLVVQKIEPEDVPDSTVDADAQPVVDMDDDVNGTVVEFDENVTVDALVFPNASNGTATVADLEELPANLSVAPGVLVQAMEITVPEELENQSATIRLSLSAEQYDGDPDRIHLARFNDDSWQVLEPTSVEESDGELVYEFQTPGFSTFAVFAQEPDDTQSTTTQSTATDTGGAAEEAGMGTFSIVAFAVVAVIAALLAVAGARIYRQN
ncbi:PGF-pre-PGF domain-containing protein [Natronomonas salina]|uniref:PGF-pre-PGF domain-containing protein n=1 Tax=Natronomonas salina TaxID=1710540 RepID=UPI0015B4D425|nr:PGF-pre-PGF domain-containing protein [Natronomonas salina]QLD91155.1 PGF-pre-PGF domain-containing protein [Natronomonas salina]